MGARSRHEACRRWAVRERLRKGSENGWWVVLSGAVREYAVEASSEEVPADDFVEWLVEWGVC